MTQAILTIENVLLGAKISTKEEAIKLAGKLLIDQGYVENDYVDKMMEREELTPTYMGNFLAIPHGTEDAKKSVKSSGISIVQIPEGFDYGGGQIVKLVIGIAGKDNEHLNILSTIAIVCSDLENVEKMINAATKQELLTVLEGVN